jgi:hypothetical protein
LHAMVGADGSPGLGSAAKQSARKDALTIQRLFGVQDNTLSKAKNCGPKGTEFDPRLDCKRCST